MKQKQNINRESIKSLSLAATECLHKNDVMGCRAKLVIADSLLSHEIGYHEKNIPPEYEYALRTYFRYYEKPGIHLVVEESVTRPSLFDYSASNKRFIDEETIGKLESDKLVIWNFIENKREETSLSYDNPYLLDTYSLYLEEKRVKYDDKIICIDRGGLCVKKSLKDSCVIGQYVPISVSFMDSYQFNSSGDRIVILKDNTIYLGDYLSGSVELIHQFQNPINTISTHPKKDNQVALMFEDSLLVIYDIEKRQELSSRRMNFQMYGAKYTPNGRNVLAYGRNLELLWSSTLKSCCDPVTSKEIGYLISDVVFSEDGKLMYDGFSIRTSNPKYWDYCLVSNTGKYSIDYYFDDQNKDVRHYFMRRNGVSFSDWEVIRSDDSGFCFNEMDTYFLYPECSVDNNESQTKYYHIMSLADGSTMHTIKSKDGDGENKAILNFDGSKVIEYNTKKHSLRIYDVQSQNNVCNQEIIFSNLLYAPENDMIVLVSDGKLYTLTMDLKIKDEMTYDVKDKITALTLNKKGTNLYYSTSEGDVCRFNLKTGNHEYLFSYQKPISLLCVDNDEHYIITHNSSVPDFLSVKSIYDTKVWNLNTRGLVEDISSYEAVSNDIKWVYKSSMPYIDVGYRLISFKKVLSLRWGL